MSKFQNEDHVYPFQVQPSKLQWIEQGQLNAINTEEAIFLSKQQLQLNITSKIVCMYALAN